MGTSFTFFGSLAFAWLAGIFGYHFWLGWRTRIVRFPVSVFAVQEFEHDRSPGNFWGIMAVDMLASIAALVAAVYFASSALLESRKPIDRIEALDGCYEGEGAPDFLRPRVHWHFRVAGGAIYDRTGKAVSRIGLLGTTSSATSLAFTPGILLAYKPTRVYPGDAATGTAWLNGSGATIALDDEWGDVMRTTSCG